MTSINGTVGRDATRWIDDYIAALPADQAQVLTQLRKAVAAAAPDAVETVSYSMPAFRLGRRVLVYYAAFRDHLSLFPASATVMDRLGPQLRAHFTGKGTIQFAPEAPLPDELVASIVAVRRDEITGG